MAAEDMYISQLFAGMRQYAEQNANAWFILSAEYGVLRPDQVVAPYDRTLTTMRKRDRWHGPNASNVNCSNCFPPVPW